MKQEMNDGITAYFDGKSLYQPVIAIILFSAKVEIFPLSYAVIPSFISCFTTFYCLDPYLTFKLIIFNIPVFVFFVIPYSFIRVTVLLG